MGVSLREEINAQVQQRLVLPAIYAQQLLRPATHLTHMSSYYYSLILRRGNSRTQSRGINITTCMHDVTGTSEDLRITRRI